MKKILRRSRRFLWAVALAIAFLPAGEGAYAQRPPGTGRPRPAVPKPERPPEPDIPPEPDVPLPRPFDVAKSLSTDLSISLAYVRAVGEFRRNVAIAFGITASAHPFFRARAVRLGFEGGYFLYGADTRNLSQLVQGAPAEVETESRIFTLGVGPRIVRALGPLAPYASGSVGAAVFLTDSCIRPASRLFTRECDYRSADAIDVAPAASLGAGLQVRLKNGSRPLYLHLGTRYLVTGPVRYVTQASIVSGPDENNSFRSVQTSTQMWVFQLGVSGRL